MMRVARTLLPLLLLCACDAASLPPPTILSVAPEKIPEGSPAVLSVRVSAAPPVTFDYQDETGEPYQQEMRLRIGGQDAAIAFTEEDGTLVAAVPEGLSMGPHAVQVILEDGREAVREQAFSVVLPTLMDGPPEGTSPSDKLLLSGVTAFQIDPIGEQVRGQPFSVTIRAVGPKAAGFQGDVLLRGSKGTLSTLAPSAFEGGVRVEQITVSHPGHISLLVEDGEGRRGVSNIFKVREH